MGPADSDRITRVLPYSGTARSARRRSGTGMSPSASPAFQPGSRPTLGAPFAPPYYPGAASTAPVWATPRSLATTGGIDFSFSSCRYWDVSVPCVRPHRCVRAVSARGLPHSDTPGSSPVCGSPGSFAAYRVLHRLWKPRHPPCALILFLRARRIVSNRLLVSRCCISFRLLDVLYLYCFSHNISMNNRFSQTGCKGTTFFQPCKFFKLKFKKSYTFFYDYPQKYPLMNNRVRLLWATSRLNLKT